MLAWAPDQPPASLNSIDRRSDISQHMPSILSLPSLTCHPAQHREHYHMHTHSSSQIIDSSFSRELTHFHEWRENKNIQWMPNFITNPLIFLKWQFPPCFYIVQFTSAVALTNHVHLFFCFFYFKLKFILKWHKKEGKRENIHTYTHLILHGYTETRTVSCQSPTLSIHVDGKQIPWVLIRGPIRTHITIMHAH